MIKKPHLIIVLNVTCLARLLSNKVLVGGILLTDLQNLPCNTHNVAEIVVPAGSVKDSVQSEIGAASFGTLSHINHSCDVRGGAGEEIMDNYGYHYAVVAVADLQHSLHRYSARGRDPARPGQAHPSGVQQVQHAVQEGFRLGPC